MVLAVYGAAGADLLARPARLPCGPGRLFRGQDRLPTIIGLVQVLLIVDQQLARVP